MKNKLIALKCSVLLCILFLHGTAYAQLVSTFAGSGAATFVNGTGTAASFNYPAGVATDNLGNIYVADFGNHVIRKISYTGVVTTLAGTGASGSADGAGSAATFISPRGLAVDSIGNVYVADFGANKIRKITPAGVVSTFAGTGQAGALDGAGNIATFSEPSNIAIGPGGNLFVTDRSNNKIRKINANAVVSTLAGSGTAGSADGTGTAASFNLPFGITIDRKTGNLYVTDSQNHKIRRITQAGVVSTVAGSSSNLPGSADGKGSVATFNNPYGIAIDDSSMIYVVDNGNQTIRRITSGVVTTFAGQLGTAGKAEGVGSAASFDMPYGIAAGSSSELIVADYNNHKIRKIKMVPSIGVRTANGDLANNGSFDFGSTGLGKVIGPVTFGIDNLGIATLLLSSTPPIAISGANASDFTISTTSATTYLPHDKGTYFTITFAPSSAGTKTATLKINSNSYQDGNYSITLTGTGVVPTLRILGQEQVIPGTVEAYKADIINPTNYTYSWTYSGTGHYFAPSSTGQQVGIFFTDSATAGKLTCTAYLANGAPLSKTIDISFVTPTTEAAQLSKLKCAGEVSDCSTGYIDNFKFNSISNLGTGCSANGYTDYTRSTLTDTVETGAVYSATVTIPNSSTSVINYVSMWIDYDNDGQFNSSDEFVAEASGNGSEIKLTNIVLRNKSGYDGPKRLRVRSRPSVTFTSTDACPQPGEFGETEDYLIVISAEAALEAPEIITPNNDGQNDYFVIHGVKPETKNKLVVYDRTGVLLFSKTNYENNWAGTTSDGGKLDPGTYYYVFTNKNNTIKGFVEIRY